MTDKKISELTQITGADVDDANDEFAIVDSSASETKAITRAELLSSVSAITTTGDITVGGDLTVNGTTTTINTQTLDVEDKNITVAFGAADAAAADGAGLTVDGADATITYVSSGDNWSFNKDIDVTGDVAVSGTVDGRDVASDGSKLDGIEAGATGDQTASEIKTSYESNADTNAFTDAEQSKLSGIEANADVTDTANVTAAGALMDSEVTNLSDVKSFDPTDYATAAQGDLADTSLQPGEAVLQTSATSSAVLPSGTDAQRDGTPSAGYIRFNTTSDSFEGYDGTAWGEIGGDFSSVAEDILPDADNTRDIGANGNEWAEGHFETINAQNYGDGTDSVPASAVLQGTAKVYAEITSSFALTTGYNVASLTDGGAGLCTINYTNALTSIGGHGATVFGNARIASLNAPTTSSAPYRIYTTGDVLDNVGFGCAAFGDLA